MLFTLLTIASALELPLTSFRSPLKLAATRSNDIEIGNYYNEFYYLGLKVGNPETHIWVTIDTGSKYLWLTDITCKTCDYADNLYNSTLSTSEKVTNQSYTLTYGTSTVSGRVIKDSIKIANSSEFSLPAFPFLSVNQATGFDDFSADGILGLAFPDHSSTLPNLVQSLKSEGKIDKASFSLYLNHNYLDELISTNPTATLLLGEYDMKFAKEAFRFLKIQKESGLWVTDLVQIKADVIRDGVVKDTTTVSGIATKVEFSTGSPMILAPITEYNGMMELITDDYTCYESEGEIYCFCASYDDFPIFTFNIAGKDFGLDPEFYVQSSMGVCRILIGKVTGDNLVLGLPFLRKYYSYFDYEKEKIGLALGVKNYIVVSSGNYFGLVALTCLGSFVAFRFYKGRKGEELSYVRY